MAVPINLQEHASRAAKFVRGPAGRCPYKANAHFSGDGHALLEIGHSPSMTETAEHIDHPNGVGAIGANRV